MARSSIKKQSSKGAKENKEYARVCKEIDQEMIDDVGYVYCTSCGLSRGAPIGHSHLLPKGRFPQFKTLKKNISPRCQDFGTHKGCHDALDRQDIKRIAEFDDFDQIMLTLLELDIDTYNQFVTDLEEAGIDTLYEHKIV